MRGYFGIGVEGLSKTTNAGNLFRTAHAFGASFLFTIGGTYSRANAFADTSRAARQLPFYPVTSAADLALPSDCALVGIELLEEAVALPSFRHPLRAAYVLGPERGSLSQELRTRCDHLVKIPTRFCINLAVAGAIVLYDRAITLGKFGERPVSSLGKAGPAPVHVHGKQIFRSGRKTRSKAG